MTVHTELAAIDIDCASPKAPAEFYRNVIGWKITHADHDSAYLGEGPIHVENATGKPLALGASKPDFQPGEGRWTVLADPEGHLFWIAAA
ncbi:VOC family protein [Nocardia sp. NPDC047648]|uniref:VOC family protein n=1 Tax=Nocardia sp. NPDC047648 TaxID=3155625 RepID=UPI0033FB52B9